MQRMSDGKVEWCAGEGHTLAEDLRDLREIARNVIHDTITVMDKNGGLLISVTKSKWEALVKELEEARTAGEKKA